MSNISSVSLQLAAAVSNGIAQSQAVAAAGNLTLNGSLVSGGVATMDVARRVIVASTGNESSVTFTVYGTSRDGVTQTDTITGVNISTVASTLDFKTVTRVAASAACAGNVTAGTNATGSSPWIVDNPFTASWYLAVAVAVDPSAGAVTYTVEHTYDDVNRAGTSTVLQPEQVSLQPQGFTPPKAWANATLSGLSADGQANYANQPIMAHRVTVTAGTGKVTMQSIQAGIGLV